LTVSHSQSRFDKQAVKLEPGFDFSFKIKNLKLLE
jgi:hypothetical protein